MLNISIKHIKHLTLKNKKNKYFTDQLNKSPANAK
jgi:hypothetical protein